MHRLILVLSLALAACTAPSGSPSGVYRAAGTPIYSSAVFDSGRLAGRWQQAAAYGAPKGCRPGGVEITRRAGGLHAAFRLCASGREWRGAGALEPAGPGRFAIAGTEWWILWADGDYRTLAIGTPDGRFGFVLDRSGGITADRLTAARGIFEWNGYDPAGLQPL